LFHKSFPLVVYQYLQDCDCLSGNWTRTHSSCLFVIYYFSRPY